MLPHVTSLAGLCLTSPYPPKFTRFFVSMLQWKPHSKLLCAYIRDMYSHLQQLYLGYVCTYYARGDPILTHHSIIYTDSTVYQRKTSRSKCYHHRIMSYVYIINCAMKRDGYPYPHSIIYTDYTPQCKPLFSIFCGKKLLMASVSQCKPLFSHFLWEKNFS